MTCDLYLGQVKVQRKISYKKCLGQGAKYHGMNELCPSIPGTLQFIHSFFFLLFSALIQGQHDILRTFI